MSARAHAHQTAYLVMWAGFLATAAAVVILSTMGAIERRQDWKACLESGHSSLYCQERAAR